MASSRSQGQFVVASTMTPPRGRAEEAAALPAPVVGPALETFATKKMINVHEVNEDEKCESREQSQGVSKKHRIIQHQLAS